MVVFFFYVSAIALLFAACAALADFLGWLHPEWMEEER